MLTVYRLQKKDGTGPFSGEQECCVHLVYHKDPEDMLTGIGMTRYEFNRRMQMGWKFGWSNEERVKTFIRSGRERYFKKAGFSWSVFKVKEYVIFEDGQVMYSPQSASAVNVKIPIDSIRLS